MLISYSDPVYRLVVNRIVYMIYNRVFNTHDITNIKLCHWFFYFFFQIYILNRDDIIHTRDDSDGTAEKGRKKQKIRITHRTDIRCFVDAGTPDRVNLYRAV